MIVSPASRMLSAISFGVFWRLRAFDERDHPVEEGLAGLAVMRTTIWSDSTRVPPVTAERSPPTPGSPAPTRR